MIYACDECHFLFKSEEEEKQCPDCGKYRVRPANEAKIDEFKKVNLKKYRKVMKCQDNLRLPEKCAI